MKYYPSIDPQCKRRCNQPDPVVLVTGAATNTGLGIATAFTKQGWRVFMNDIRADDLHEAVGKLGAGVTGLVADIADAVAVRRIFQTIDKHGGRLDVLVNNACHLGCFKSMLDITLDDFSRVMAVNLQATFYLSQLAARRMMKQKGGVIVNMSSNTVHRAIRNRCDYLASKGGVEALTRAMALELGPMGIRVNAVAPGYIHTDRWNQIPAKSVRRRRKNLPTGREACIQDIANVVLFLAGPQSAGMSGTVVTVDQGASAQLLPADCEV